MTPSDSSNDIRPSDAPDDELDLQAAADSSPPDSELNALRKRILIGSQRDPAAYRARQRRDWTPVEELPEGRKNRSRQEMKPPAEDENKQRETPQKPAAEARDAHLPSEASEGDVAEDSESIPEGLLQPGLAAASPHTTTNLVASLAAAIGASNARVSKPSVRDKLSPELEDELNRAMGDASMDELLGDGAKSEHEPFELESLQSGRVIAVRRDDVFVEFAGRQQGIVSLRMLDVPPSIGSVIQVVVQRLNPEDGLYELTIPNKAVQVDDWSDLVEGALIEVCVTGHNTGGLECEVNHIRGFIPVSQIALYRVEDLAQFVGQRMACVITEANPERRNLVLSRRAVLEREREQARQDMLDSLKPGQVRDGIVRKLMDFGAFVDLGGADGLLHVSQLAWGRVKHPSDVLQEGQAIKVRVEKIDPATGKISLAYRDLLENPWTTAAQKYPPNSIASGVVTKLMDFGAFVELEPGIEGLVHISELSHKRVWRCSDVVKEGEKVEVMVRSIDTAAQRMSLSMKELSAPPEPATKKEEEAAEAAPVPSKKNPKPAGPLLGGLGRRTGDRFGLKW